jgi:hypothetical protein
MTVYPRRVPNTYTAPGYHKPLGYQQITVGAAAGGLTVPEGAYWCLIIPETQAIRWRDDGVDPTAAIGMPLAVAQPLEYSGDLATFKYFRQVAGAIINVVYYGP